MENMNCNDTENDNFQMYFNMMKSNEMSCKLFIQNMKYTKYMVPLLDFAKSKKLIFDLLEEINGFIEREAEYRHKLQINRVSELEQLIEILQKENESLKKERDELQGKLASFLDPKGNHRDMSSDSKPSTFSKGKDFQKKNVTNIKVEEFDIDQDAGSVSNEIIGNYESLEKQNYHNTQDFEKEMDIVTDIKIEEFDISGNIGSVSNEIIDNDERLEEQNYGYTQKSVKMNHLSVNLIRLSESHLENYSKVNHEPINTRFNFTDSTSKYCERCDKSFSSVQHLKLHIVTVHKGLKKYKCIKCDKSFGQSGNLKRHNETVHMGLKKFKCNKCGKAFGKAENLKIHNETVHEGLKKYKCKECGKAFGQAGNLRTHIKVVHGGSEKL